MGAIRPFLIAGQTLALAWTVAAALGPLPRLFPALAVSAIWLLWQWANRRWPRRTAQASWAAVAALALLAWLRPTWAPWPGLALDAALAQWRDLRLHLSTRDALGYGVTALPLLVLAQQYVGQFPGARGNSREALRSTAYGLTAMLLAGLYNWPPVLWGCLGYVPLAFAYIAHTRAEELAFARYRGDVRWPMLTWGTTVAVALLLVTLVVPDWSGPIRGSSWRPAGKPPVVSARIPMPGVDYAVEEQPEDIYPLPGEVGEPGENRERSPWLALYLALLLVGLAVPSVLVHRWANRRRAVAADAAETDDLWPDLPDGPWPGVIVKAFLWLVARLSGRRLRPGLTATEHVAALSAQRPALAAPLQRMLRYFLPARYGPGAADDDRALADVRHDWEAVRQHLREEAIKQRSPAWAGRLLVTWQRLRLRRHRRGAGGHGPDGRDRGE